MEKIVDCIGMGMVILMLIALVVEFIASMVHLNLFGMLTSGLIFGLMLVVAKYIFSEKD